MSTLTVELGERSYPILIEAGLLGKKNLIQPFLKTNKVVIVTNDVVKPLLLAPLLYALGEVEHHVIVLPDGEQHKTLASFEKVLTQLLEIHAARDTTIIALGGGVIGDLTGYVAASFQRGMPFIQIPTTLLSQVDSSVGGKTAVNHPLGKNMIGAFYQPKAVLIDTASLQTLPAREFSAGMAEVIKYGVIYDEEFFVWLEQNVEQLKQQNPETLQHAIFRCCEIKAEIVAQDEQEAGIRALLNLGHTFGHAIEAEQGYGNWLHGEAVAAGIVLACVTSTKKNWLSTSNLRRVEALLLAFDLPIEGPSQMGFTDFVKHMRHDKKVKAGRIRFILPTGIGSAVVTDDVDDEMLKAILN
jgi:3-dehydroquinate synthase